MAFLSKEFGIDPYDGLLAAYLPKLDAVMNEHHRDNLTVYSWRGTVYDMLDKEQARVKWWRVQGAARQLGLGIVEPVWSGAAADFNLDDTRQRFAYMTTLGYKLYIRSFSHGPWILLDNEQEQEVGGG